MGFSSTTFTPVQIQTPSRLMLNDLSGGQKTALEPDKYTFDSFQRLKNFITNKGDLELRRGYKVLTTIPTQRGMGIFQFENENQLLVVQDDGAGSKLTKIDRITGGETDLITGQTEQNRGSFASLRSYLYWADGLDAVNIWDGTTATFLVIPNNGRVSLVTADEKRIWAVGKPTNGNDVLYFSKDDGTGVVTAFDTGASDTIDRGGIATSQITNFVALKSTGKVIVAVGKNRTEIHGIPDFAEGGLKEFVAGMPTLIFEYENIGVESAEAVFVVGNDIYLKPNDGNLYKINSISGSLKVLRDNLSQMEAMDWTNCSMGYNKNKNLLYIQGKTNADHDTTIVFNIEEETFSYFDNVWATQWDQDADNIYFVNTNNEIIDAFGENQFLDKAFDIDWEVFTQPTYGSDIESYKKVSEYFLHTKVFENTDIKVEGFSDRSIGGTESPSFIDEISVVLDSNYISSEPQSFGLGVWGAGNSIQTEFPNNENIFNNKKINSNFERFEIKLSGSSTNKFKIKGVGIKFYQTERKVKNLVFNQ